MASTFIFLPENNSVAAGVQSFNSRVGAVSSAPGDYTAAQISYNNFNSGLSSTNAQSVIDELASRVQTSASPGFSFGRAGSVNAGTYLQCETVPSNVSGRWVYIANALVRSVFVSNELQVPYSLDVAYHSGNNTSETIIGTINVTSGYGGAFMVNWAVPANKQLSIKISASSPNAAKNIVCGLELSGSQ